MAAQLAQEAGRVETLCGEGWLCPLVYERTGDELVARLAGVVDVIAAFLLIVVVAWLATRLTRRLVQRFAAGMEVRIEDRLERAHQRGAITRTERYRTRRIQRLQAITGVVRGVFNAVIWISAILLVFARLGVPLQPLITGAGLAGIVLGFGAQQLVRDVLAGIAMLIEDQYGVGDFIEVEGKVGEVERVGLRATSFRDLDGVVHHVLNGYLQRVGNLSQSWARAVFDVPLALDTDLPTARDVIWEVCVELGDDPVWGHDAIGPPEIWGVQYLGPDGLALRVSIPTKPLRNWDMNRQMRERIKAALDTAGIRMPAQLVDLGGLPDGHPVLTHEVPTDARRRPGALSPRRTSGPTRETADDDADTIAPRDQTTELRIEYGPRARPD